MKAVDLFCGCGGLSLGFEQAGLEIAAAFDNWDKALAVYRANFNHPAHELDLSGFNGDTKFLGKYAPEIIIGGPPCQDFSSAGKRDENLGRADLTKVFADIVNAYAPRYFVMENVDRAIKSKAYAKAKKSLREKYALSERVLNACFCGVPQIRKRLFLIGELHGKPDGIGKYLDANLSQTPTTLRQYFGSELETEYIYRHPRSYQRRAIFSVDEPSPTIRGVNRPIPAGYPGHPGDPVPISPGVRPLTTEERSRVQTFPKEFKWIGTKADKEQMIGNAVPVKLAEYIARAVLSYINHAPLVRASSALSSQSVFEWEACLNI